jgi:predicted dehydrogenase
VKQKTKIAVIGVGHLGKHHVEHLSNIKNVTLAGVYDIDRARAEGISKTFKIDCFNSIQDLLKNVDAVSIVTPTKNHKDVAELCIKAGKHVFIEKPITETVEEADTLIGLSKEHNTIIQVGHIERLNPALLPLEGYELNPKFVEVQRLAPYMIRGSDIPVVLDLMIHDIDLILTLIPSPVKHIESTGVSIMTNSVDIANARITFENGATANLTSSRVAKDRVRKLKIFQEDLYITVDFLIGLTEIYRAMDADQNDPNAIMTAPLESNGKHRQIFYEKPKIAKTDALKMELINFVKSIKGEESPVVDGPAGRNALKIAIEIQNKILEDFKK